jgi:hypothetical protein
MSVRTDCSKLRTILAVFPRGDREIEFSWVQYDGRRFLQIGTWTPHGGGPLMNLSVSELSILRESIDQAIAMAAPPLPIADDTDELF